MEVVFMLIPIALFLVGLIILVFWWATRTGQFDDLEGPAYRILMDDDTRPPPRADEEKENNGQTGSGKGDAD